MASVASSIRFRVRIEFLDLDDRFAGEKLHTVFIRGTHARAVGNA